LGEHDPDLLEREPWQSLNAAQAEWALEREIELARLERENEELRALITAGQAIPIPAPKTALPPQAQVQPVTKPPIVSIADSSAEAEVVEEDKTEAPPPPQPGSPEAEPEAEPEVEDDCLDPYATVKMPRMSG
jgi:hypothetical protein